MFLLKDAPFIQDWLSFYEQFHTICGNAYVGKQKLFEAAKVNLHKGLDSSVADSIISEVYFFNISDFEMRYLKRTGISKSTICKGYFLDNPRRIKK